MTTRRRITAVLVCAALVTSSATHLAAPQVAELRARAFDYLYNLDQHEAQTTLEQALAADPNDPATYRAMATVAWLSLLFKRGVVTVEDYIGHLNKQTLPVDKPPPDIAALFTKNADRALALGEKMVSANPRSADAHYAVGAVVSLMSLYRATAEGQVMGGLKAAKRAYNEQEEALRLDPRRKDAGLVVGTYRYVVSMLPFYLRVMAYIVGFGGGRERGLKMIEEAADHPSDSQNDAKFALVLLYNREQRYADAMRVIRDLQHRFPRNRLLWLEGGATLLRAGNAREADAVLSEGIARLASDRRPRSFGEEALWYYKRGAARVRLGQRETAAADLRAALKLEGRNWVKGRIHTELGRLADLAGDRARAVSEYQTAVRLSDGDNDPGGAADARALLNKPYTGR
jgi:tetratricopeptide (TPR) repeat protein